MLKQYKIAYTLMSHKDDVMWVRFECVSEDKNERGLMDGNIFLSLYFFFPSVFFPHFNWDGIWVGAYISVQFTKMAYRWCVKNFWLARCRGNRLHSKHFPNMFTIFSQLNRLIFAVIYNFIFRLENCATNIVYARIVYFTHFFFFSLSLSHTAM